MIRSFSSLGLFPAIARTGLAFLGSTGIYLAREIRKVCEKEGQQPLRILDLGSGAGAPWMTAASFLGSEKFELTTVDSVVAEAHGATFSNHCGKITQIEGDLFEELSKIEDSSFDLVTAFDVIEHLNKESGFLLLYEIIRVSKSLGLINTPNGFLLQPPDPENPSMAHISGWAYREFKSLGFRVRSHHGLAKTNGPYMTKSYKLNTLTATIYIAEALVCKIFPSLGASVFVSIDTERHDFARLRSRERGLSIGDLLKMNRRR